MRSARISQTLSLLCSVADQHGVLRVISYIQLCREEKSSSHPRFRFQSEFNCKGYNVEKNIVEALIKQNQEPITRSLHMCCQEPITIIIKNH